MARGKPGSSSMSHLATMRAFTFVPRLLIRVRPSRSPIPWFATAAVHLDRPGLDSTSVRSRHSHNSVFPAGDQTIARFLVLVFEREPGFKTFALCLPAL